MAKRKTDHLDEAIAMAPPEPEIVTPWKRSRTDYTVELRADDGALLLLAGQPRDVWLVGDVNRIVGRAAGFRAAELKDGRRAIVCVIDFDSDAWANAWKEQPWQLKVMDYDVIGPVEV